MTSICGFDHSSSPPPPRHAEPVSSFPPTAGIMFSHTILEKMDTKNYRLWGQKVELDIKGHCLHHYLVNLRIAPKFYKGKGEDRVIESDLGFTEREREQRRNFKKKG